MLARSQQGLPFDVEKFFSEVEPAAGGNWGEWSGLSESNRHLNLGKVPYYHYTKAASQ